MADFSIDAIISQAVAGAEERKPFGKIKARLHSAVEHTVNTIANEVYIEAQKRAPVRKVFQGGRNSTRGGHQFSAGMAGLTDAGRMLAMQGSKSRVTRRSRAYAENPFSRDFDERFLEARASAIAEQRRVNRIGVQGGTKELSLATPDIPNARDVKVGSGGRVLGLAHGKLVEPALTGRGQYELRTGRAVFAVTGGAPTLGGRLRKEIDIQPLQKSGSIFLRRVVSPTPYAKYVEFGTRYAAAQPYLRPALAAVREKFATVMRDQLRRAATDVRSSRGYAKQSVGSNVTKKIRVTKAEVKMFRRMARGG